MLSMVADQEVEDDLLVVSDGHKYSTNVWILDSAYSHHYTPNWSWVATCSKMDKGSVTLGDNHPCKVASIGTIGVRMLNNPTPAPARTSNPYTDASMLELVDDCERPATPASCNKAPNMRVSMAGTFALLMMMLITMDVEAMTMAKGTLLWGISLS